MTSLRPLLRIAVLTAAIPLCTINDTALAQAPAPTTGKAACGAKPDFPGRLASDLQRRAWQRDANEYLACYKKYALAKQQIAQEFLKAANDAVDEYNAAAKELEAAGKGE
jgi:hypothetical protein